MSTWTIITLTSCGIYLLGLIIFAIILSRASHKAHKGGGK
jgi:hypothetical protein